MLFNILRLNRDFNSFHTQRVMIWGLTVTLAAWLPHHLQVAQ